MKTCFWFHWPRHPLARDERWEDSRRRVRVVFAGVTVADSKRVMLLHEFGRLPVFYFPLEDVRMDLLESTEHRTHSPLKGEASYWTVRVGDRSAKNAAWSYPQPLPEGPKIQGHLAFYWDLMDAWYEEEQLTITVVQYLPATVPLEQDRTSALFVHFHQLAIEATSLP